MSAMQDAGAASPFATLWLSPRQTIERIVAGRPTYLVLPLAIVGTIASFYAELVLMGLADSLISWRLWLFFVAASEIGRAEEHTSELQSQSNLVCRLLLEKK